jgi:hypothetical protein
MHLIHLVSFIISFTVIFTVTSVLITIKHIWIYLCKMFDLPADIIVSMIALREEKNEDKNEEV